MKEKGAFAFSVFISLLFMVMVAGFWFHTSSHNAVIFGKYNVKYFVGLCLLTALSPFVFWFSKIIFVSQKIILSSGRKINIRPSNKIVILFFILLFFTILAELRLGRQHNLIIDKREKILRQFHPYLQAIPLVGDKRSNINRWGFRGEEIEKEKPDRTYRIFVLGGSTVLCDRVNFERSHCRVLEKILRKKYTHIKIEVQNAGMHWHTSQHSLIKFLSFIQDFHPDLIIIYHGINDLYRSFSPIRYGKGEYKNDYSHFYGPLSEILKEYTSTEKHGLLVVQKIKQIFSTTWFSDYYRHQQGPYCQEPKPVMKKEWKSLKAFERNMGDLANIVTSKNIDLIIASQPYLYKKGLTEREKQSIWIPQVFCAENGQKPDIASMINGMEMFNETSKKIAQESAAYFVDLEQKVPKTLDYFIDDVHYTKKGNRIIGRAFSEKIFNSKLIERKFPR